MRYHIGTSFIELLIALSLLAFCLLCFMHLCLNVQAAVQNWSERRNAALLLHNFAELHEAHARDGSWQHQAEDIATFQQTANELLPRGRGELNLHADQLWVTVFWQAEFHAIEQLSLPLDFSS